jgi:hypothetical protein
MQLKPIAAIVVILLVGASLSITGCSSSSSSHGEGVHVDAFRTTDLPEITVNVVNGGPFDFDPSTISFYCNRSTIKPQNNPFRIVRPNESVSFKLQFAACPTWLKYPSGNDTTTHTSVEGNAKDLRGCENPDYAAYVYNASLKCRELREALKTKSGPYYLTKYGETTTIKNETWRFQGDYLILDCGCLNESDCDNAPVKGDNVTSRCKALYSGVETIHPTNGTIKSVNLTIFYLFRSSWAVGTWVKRDIGNPDEPIGPAYTIVFPIFVFQNQGFQYVGHWVIDGRILPQGTYYNYEFEQWINEHRLG